MCVYVRICMHVCIHYIYVPVAVLAQYLMTEKKMGITLLSLFVSVASALHRPGAGIPYDSLSSAKRRTLIRGVQDSASHDRHVLEVGTGLTSCASMQRRAPNAVVAKEWQDILKEGKEYKLSTMRLQSALSESLGNNISLAETLWKRLDTHMPKKINKTEEYEPGQTSVTRIGATR